MVKQNNLENLVSVEKKGSSLRNTLYGVLFIPGMLLSFPSYRRSFTAKKKNKQFWKNFSYGLLVSSAAIGGTFLGYSDELISFINAHQEVLFSPLVTNVLSKAYENIFVKDSICSGCSYKKNCTIK